MPRPLLLFAHGAGAPSSHPWIRRHAARFGEFASVETFDYPYARAGRKAPDRLPTLISAHRSALADARRRHPEAAPVVLLGKSMGGRVGCHVALEEDVDGVVCLGYPLVPRSGGAPRDEVLLAQRRPLLLIQGTRDAMAPLDRLRSVIARMKAPTTLAVVDGGDHSLEVGVRELARTERTVDSIERSVADAVRTFVASLRR